MNNFKKYTSYNNQTKLIAFSTAWLWYWLCLILCMQYELRKLRLLTLVGIPKKIKFAKNDLLNINTAITSV